MMRGTLLAFGLLLLCMSPAHAQLRAWLDRNEIALGETVTLNIQVQGAGATAPDFSSLDSDFERRGSSSSSQISLVNGQRSATTLFAVSLQPRREGELIVPALQVGGEQTPPLTVSVGPSPISTGTGGDVFLEVSLSADEVYVQQQVTYSLKLYYAVSLWDGQLDAPTGDGVQSFRLGDDLKYQVERDGRRYSVIERRFALVPERSGELPLAAARFDGTGLDRGGYGGLLGSGGIRLNAAGKPLTLTVRPRPSAAETPWLPASDLTLNVVGEVLPEEVRVGEPISLGLQLRARGLLPAQLPELTLPPIAGAAVYPDQASSRDQTSADGLAGERFQRFAIVPQQAGSLEIPAIRIPWWDTGADVQRWAELPARQLRVLPGVTGDVGSDTLSSEAAAADPDLEVETTSGDPERSGAPPTWPWMLISALLALGWVLSLRMRKAPTTGQPVAEPVDPPLKGPVLHHALRGGDLQEIAAALRAAARHTEGSAGSLASRYVDPDQHDAVKRLERALYASAQSADANGLLIALRQAFSRPVVLREPAAKASRSGQPYPPLYG
jgi:hypothetical protein